MLLLENINLAVIGLGYVGLPLAMKFAKIRTVVGYDINSARVSDLKRGVDSTMEVDENEILKADTLHFTSDPSDLKECNCI